MLRRFSPLALLLLTSVPLLAGDAGFAFQDKAGEYLDVLLDGKPAVRFMYAFDTSTPARQHDTYKPYLHVFDAEGFAPITKGPGRQFTHHRGIFIGWNKVTVDGKTMDLWHMKNTSMVHQKFGEQKAGADNATFTALINWNDAANKPVLEEERTFTIRRGPAPLRLTIDFTSKLKAANDTKLDGDPEHAGIHYRPADEVDKSKTVYVFPKENAEPTKEVDYAWVGETYSLKGKLYSIVHVNHPGNPKNTRYSAYRDYGRFGAFPVTTIKAGETATFKYRFLVADGEMPKADVIQKSADEFTGAATPSPVPPLTVKAVPPPKEKK
ncbi:MAG TPA: DUF6807 family protein [Planctomycetota bacterium]|nr:DUF6807 family protein [Planctomycetota bacterium]